MRKHNTRIETGHGAGRAERKGQIEGEGRSEEQSGEGMTTDRAREQGLTAVLDRQKSSGKHRPGKGSRGEKQGESLRDIGRNSGR